MTGPAEPPRSLTALLERSWETARTLREGVRAPAFRLLAQRLDGGALHDAPPPRVAGRRR